MKDQQGNEIVVTVGTDQPTADANNLIVPTTAERVSRLVKFKALLHIFWVRKKISIPVLILATLLLLATVPFTRYQIFGLFLKQDYAVKVTDSITGKPISSAKVTLGSMSETTDANGETTLKTKVGNQKLTIEKNYYEASSQSVTVPLTKKAGVFRQVSLKATGRQVPVSVSNRLTGQPIKNITVKAADTEAVSGEDGMAVVVLPAGQDSFEAELSGEGINPMKVNIVVSEELKPENQFSVTPIGKVYFLSKQSGKIDVVKTDLDGSNRQTVLAGTGKEDENETVLLAARDWKYLALYSKRDGGKYAKLFLIDTQKNDELVVIDEGEAQFTLYGWADHHFAYKVERYNVQSWVIKKHALKAYDADGRKIVLLDETQAFGDAQNYIDEQYQWAHLMGKQLVFFRAWTSHKNFYTTIFPELSVKQSKVVSIDVDGSNRRDLKTYDIAESISGATTYYQPYSSYQSVIYEPGELFFLLSSNNADTRYFKVFGGKIEEDMEAKDFFQSGKAYPTYLASPDGSKTFWVESRDGKNTLFIGDANGANEREIAKLSELTQYGWFTEEYLLVSKNSSELFILPVAGGQPIKVSDYHKPAYNYYGYGGGYGGI
ncbi:MAG: carboxypeptidase-like regulatory domain-containing protein [Candidatus Saccharibacteria bacterium]|nr:carboxypeptidase-like regulatory domain-containing protein [Candidatus Saccharibacteria bacterium]